MDGPLESQSQAPAIDTSMIIWLASYPRSGNTFLRVILKDVFGFDTYAIYKENPNIDPQESSQDDPVPGLAFDVARFADRDELHLVKTHDAPIDDRRAIYLLRDGRESITSYFHYYRDLMKQPTPLPEVIAGHVQFGSWGQHVADWDPGRRPNTLLLRFEQFVADPISHVEQIADFIGAPPQGGQIPTFESLHQQNPKFYRSGRTDTWKSLFTEEDLDLFRTLHGDVAAEFGYDSQLPTGRCGHTLRALLHGRPGGAAQTRAEMDRFRKDREALLDNNRALAAKLEQIRLDRETLLKTNHRLAAELPLIRKDREAILDGNRRLVAELDLIRKDRETLLANNQRLAAETTSLQAELDARREVIDNLRRAG